MGFNPLSLITGGVDKIIGAATGLIDEIITNDEERETLRVRMQEVLDAQKRALIDQVTELFKAQRDIIVAEAQGESWLQRNWRPIAMMTFLYIIVHMIVFTPIFGLPTIQPELIPAQLWELLKIGIGGYIVGRTVEKGVKTYITKE
jgi:hypothetical protein